VIEFRDFSFTYWESARPALSNVSLRIHDAEFVLVAGSSGCGKTSLCRCLNGLIPHFHGGRLSGDVTVAGLDVVSSQPRELAGLVGMVFQDPENQVIAADVERDVAFGLENGGMPVDKISNRVDEVLDLMGISSIRRSPIATLSGGEKQRVAIAAALAVRPRILVLDEPSSELDPEGAAGLLHSLANLRATLGITIVLVEHRLERVVEYVDRVLVMEEGRLVADGAPRSVLDQLESPERGIGLPPVTRLARELRSRGIWEGVTPVTVDEARGAFAPLLEALARHTAPRQGRLANGTQVSAQGLWYSYESGTTALRDVSLDVPGGQILAIMGRNASGKTTLIKHFNGLFRPCRGTVEVAGADVAGTSVAALSRRVGMVFQNPNDHLFAETVEEEVLFTLRHMGFDETQSLSRLNEVLDLFDLEPYRHLYPRSLSGGERQRVALASVVAVRPQVLILDEPTRGMEYARKHLLLQFLESYADEGNAVILVTHDVETCASHADSVVIMESGIVQARGSTRGVLSIVAPFVPQIGRMMAGTAEYGGDGACLLVEDCLEALR
jgi:energy-coupling factor transporter ATP-binding protein EcfA2